MKEFWDKAKTVFIWLVRGVIGILISIGTILLVRERKTNDFETVAKDDKQKAEDNVRSTPVHTVAERYEGVERAVDDGRNRFASRVKTRVIAAGGRRVDEQHPD